MIYRIISGNIIHTDLYLRNVHLCCNYVISGYAIVCKRKIGVTIYKGFETTIPHNHLTDLP